MVAKHLKIRRNKTKTKRNKTQHNNNGTQMTCFGGQFSSITLPSWNVDMEKCDPGWEGLPQAGHPPGRSLPSYHLNVMRDFLDRKVIPAKRVTPGDGPPPLCKQALNPRTYLQSHTPTVVQGARGWWQYFETILPSVESLWYCLQDRLCFMGGSAVWGQSRHQTWSPSWILSRVRKQVKTVRIDNFFALNM